MEQFDSWKKLLNMNLAVQKCEQPTEIHESEDESFRLVIYTG